jgi:streptogramin lyase
MCERRRAVCAALALVCVMTICSSAAWGVYERNYLEEKDFAEGFHDSINYAVGNCGIRLNDCVDRVPFLWVANPSTNTVSRIDARTGQETARYQMGPSSENWKPCVVVTDSNGNAYVACACPRSTGKVVRIAAGAGSAVDNGSIGTSGDMDSNKQITPSEVMAWGKDALVGPVYEVGPEGSQPSGLAFDSRGYLWVTLYGDASVAKLDTASGKVLTYVDTDGRPSWITAGAKGSMWIVSYEQSTICKIDSLTGVLISSTKLEGAEPSAVCKTIDDHLWIADGNGGLLNFDMESCEWIRNDIDDGAVFTSVAIDKFGDIWAAGPSAGYIASFSGEDGTLMSRTPISNVPSSVSIDSDGYLWVLCERGGYALKLDTKTMEQTALVQTGISLHSSSLCAASVLRKGVCKTGTWRTLVDSDIQGAGWGIIDWDSFDTGGGVSVKVRTADKLEDLAEASYVPVTKGMRFSSTEGRYMELYVTLDGNGYASPTLHALRVEGVNLAPKVELAKPSIDKLVAHDHNLESVSIEGVYDPEGDEFKIQITSVMQDEPVYGLCADDCSPDAVCLNDSSVWLRGECSPGDEKNPADGRVYVISFRAVDELGGESFGKVKVMVPPEGKEEQAAVEDMAKYDSFKEPAKLICANISSKG